MAEVEVKAMAKARTIESSTTVTMTKRQRAEARLEAYRKAELAILTSQSYEVDGVTLTRTNLADVQKMIAKLENALDASGGPFPGMRAQVHVPREL